MPRRASRTAEGDVGGGGQIVFSQVDKINLFPQVRALRGWTRVDKIICPNCPLIPSDWADRVKILIFN